MQRHRVVQTPMHKNNVPQHYVQYGVSTYRKCMIIKDPVWLRQTRARSHQTPASLLYLARTHRQTREWAAFSDETKRGTICTLGRAIRACDLHTKPTAPSHNRPRPEAARHTFLLCDIPHVLLPLSALHSLPTMCFRVLVHYSCVCVLWVPIIECIDDVQANVSARAHLQIFTCSAADTQTHTHSHTDAHAWQHSENGCDAALCPFTYGDH